QCAERPAEQEGVDSSFGVGSAISPNTLLRPCKMRMLCGMYRAVAAAELVTAALPVVPPAYSLSSVDDGPARLPQLLQLRHPFPHHQQWHLSRPRQRLRLPLLLLRLPAF